jgi:hypothetical protein
MAKEKVPKSVKVTDSGISYVLDKKKNGSLKWDEIQQVTLSDDELTLLTYEDRKWMLGRDRELEFDLPKGYAESVAPTLRQHLQGRFISALAATGEPVWQMPARLLEGNKGTLGTLAWRPGMLSFTGGDRTRQWPVAEIQNVSSSGRDELTLATYEKYGRLHGANRQVRFQLRAPLDPEKYQQLWREVNRVQGLQMLETK